MQYDFQWSVLWTGGRGEWLLRGISATLRISALSGLIACALGILAGALRTVPVRPLRALGAGYVEFFRNVPLLVWSFFWYFGVPQALPQTMASRQARISIPCLVTSPLSLDTLGTSGRSSRHPLARLSGPFSPDTW